MGENGPSINHKIFLNKKIVGGVSQVVLIALVEVGGFDR